MNKTSFSHSKKDIPSGHVIIISAPSGGGKTTISQKIIDYLQHMMPIAKLVSYTSRPPRPTEQNGIDYFFISRQDFQEKIKSGFFLETTEYDHNLYGSPASLITDLAQGKSFIVIIDRSSARFYLQKFPNAIAIWLVSSIQALRERLHKRNLGKHNKHTAEETERRIKLATQELESEQHERIFKYHVMNNVLEQAVLDVIAIIKNLGT
jgi:guanylate kinase